MSFTDRLVLWLHIGFAIFAIGPVAVAISSTPRYIRKRDLPVVRYLSRITLIFTIASLGVLVMGLVAAQQGKDLAKPWLAIALTLYLVAVVLLALIIRDQRAAIRALDGPALAAAAAEAGAAPSGAPAPGAPTASAGAAAAGAQSAGRPAAGGGAAPAAAGAKPGAAQRGAAMPAQVERGRIAMIGGVVNLIWLVILILMIWNA